MIVLIDNYDSFVYNIAQYLGELGVDVRVLRNDKISIPEIEMMKPSSIFISPGPCTPNEAGISMELIERIAGKIPVFGICLGHQSIAQVFGGNVIRAKSVVHGKTSMIYHDSRTIFENIKNPFSATRYHSLLVEKESLPDCFVISAWTEDGQIMGLRHKDFNIEGVQFHPESILTDIGKTLLKNVLEIHGIINP